MRRVERDEILPNPSYAIQRQELHRKVLEAHIARHIALSDHVHVIFENTQTIQFLIQETLFEDNLTAENEIRQRLDSFNGMLGPEGTLSCTLLVEIEDPDVRKQWLRACRDLPESIYLKAGLREKIHARIADPLDLQDPYLPMAVNLIFSVNGVVPVAIGAVHPKLTVEKAFTAQQLAALTMDLQRQNNFDSSSFSRW